MTGRDATGELCRLIADLPDDELADLAAEVERTGFDLYAVRVRITDAGNIPCRVDPAHLLVHFAGEAAAVATVRHPRFLRRVVLPPGGSAEGLVAYQARVDIGAAMRFGRGGLTYEDATVVVNYDP